jgi:hypothetical protein
MTAKLGFGATFSLHNGTALTAVAELLSVTPPAYTVETIDGTTHGSASGIREFIPGLIDPGELTATFHHVPGSAGTDLLEDQVAARTTRAFKIVLPTTSGSYDITGTCIPMSYAVDDVPIDDKMTATFTAKVTGAVTIAASA